MLSTRALVLSALGFLAACDLPLPPGAYFPEDVDLRTGIEDAGRADAMANFPDRPGPGGGDAGGSPGAPGGPVGTGDDAGVSTDPALARLQELTGQYFVRMDMFSTARADAFVLPIETSNRVSHLLVTELYLEDGQLKANERLCHQTFAHRCKRGCDALTTTMAKNVTNKLAGAPAFERRYTLSGMDLSTDTLAMPLGFDASGDATIPTSTSDPRVWDIAAGNPREGMLVTLDMRAGVRVFCDVYSVQNFVSQFSGRLFGQESKPSLVGATFTLQTTDSRAETLGSNNSQCVSDNPPSPTQGQQTVRFASAMDIAWEDLWKCPDASVWDQRLPATAP